MKLVKKTKTTYVLTVGRKQIELSEQDASQLLDELAGLKGHVHMQREIFEMFTKKNEPPVRTVPDPFTWPQSTGTGTGNDPFKFVTTTKCMFEDLPPGVYGISCPCPKCSPTFGTGVHPSSALVS